MSVRKRTLPSGQIRWQVDYNAQGKRRSRQFQTQKQAKDFETTVRSEIRAGTHTPDAASVTVAKAGELWLDRCRSDGLECGTLRYYQQHFSAYVIPRIGTTKLSRLTRPMVEAFKDWLIAEHSKTAAAKVLVSFKSMLSDAQRRGLVAQNVAIGVKVKLDARRERRAKIPTKDEIRALLAATSTLRPVWRAFIITSLFTGLRPSESRGLTWANVDFGNKLIHVKQRADYRNQMGAPKSKAGNRDVPLAPMVLNTLKEWRLACPKTDAGLVFPNSRGRVHGQSETWEAWTQLLAAAGLPPKSFRLYDLRHVTASLLIEQGVQPKKLQTIIGHSKVSLTLDVYGHLWQTPEDDAKAMEQIEMRLLRSV